MSKRRQKSIKTTHENRHYWQKTKAYHLWQTRPLAKSRLRWRNLIWALGVLIGVTLGGITTAKPAHATSKITDCMEVMFIFGRGSGEDLEGRSYTAWRGAIEEQLQGIDLKHDFYELGEEHQMGYQYPAVPVAGSAQGYVNAFSAFFSGGTAHIFGRSVEIGKTELAYYARVYQKACPQTRYVLGGYSQGAMIMMQSLDVFDSDKVIYITTFGDPKTYFPEGEVTWTKWIPDACRGKNLSEYRIFVPDCYADQGLLGGQIPYQPEAYAGKIGTWCNQLDFLCSSGLNIPDHSGYVEAGLYQDAAQKIREKLEMALPDKFSGELTTYARHDLVVLFDADEMLRGELKAHQARALELVDETLAQGGRVAFYAYYSTVNKKFWPNQVCGFETCTSELIKRKVEEELTYRSCGEQKSLLQALKTVMQEGELSWRQGATKSVVVLTDFSYFTEDFDGFDDDTLQQRWVSEAEIVQRSLEIDPVNVYVITEAERLEEYQGLTASTGGKAFAVSDELTEIEDMILQRPVAKLRQPEYLGVVGEMLEFDASESYSLEGAELEFAWDWGNGEFAKGEAQMAKQFNQEFDGYVQVRVSDGVRSSTMSAHVRIINVPTARDVSVEIAGLQVTYSDDGARAVVTFTTDGQAVLASTEEDVIGWMELNGGNGSLAINLGKAFTLRLTPYSAANRRGTAQVIEIKSVLGWVDYTGPNVEYDEDLDKSEAGADGELGSDYEVSDTQPESGSSKGGSSTDSESTNGQTSVNQGNAKDDPAQEKTKDGTSAVTKPILDLKTPNTGSYSG